MGFSKTLKREFEVAFSKDAQPIWFRVLKYLLLGFVVYFFWGKDLLWTILFILIIVSLTLHFWYRYKTQAWTRGYGLWKYDGGGNSGAENKPQT